MLPTGEIPKAAEAEYLEKSFRRSIEERPPQFFRTADDFHQVPFEKLTDQFTALHAPDPFDFRAENRLPISDHGECFQGGRAQLDRDGNLLDTQEPGSEFRTGSELKSPGNFDDSKRAMPGVVAPIQIVDHRSNFRAFRNSCKLQKPTSRNRLPTEKQDRFEFRHRIGPNVFMERQNMLFFRLIRLVRLAWKR